MSNTLLPCPFCGGEAAVRDIKEPSANGWVGCQRCRCFMDFVKNGKPLAIAAWNSRADVAPVVRGEWVEAKSGVMSVWPPGQVMCSVCEQRMPSQWKKMPPYCYGCGAKMEDKP